MAPVPVRRIEKPWGYEIWWAETVEYAGKLLVVNAGQQLSLQFHREKDETSDLLSGRLRLIQGPSEDELEETEIGPGQTWRNEPGLVHSIEALEDSVVVEVSTPHLEDVVRLQDRYGRVDGPRVRLAKQSDYGAIAAFGPMPLLEELAAEIAPTSKATRTPQRKRGISLSWRSTKRSRASSL